MSEVIKGYGLLLWEIDYYKGAHVVGVRGRAIARIQLRLPRVPGYRWGEGDRQGKVCGSMTGCHDFMAAQGKSQSVDGLRTVFLWRPGRGGEVWHTRLDLS
jgi:hypothetical protein